MQSTTQDEKLHALLVDDDALSLHTAAALLLRSGYNLQTANNAKETLEKTKALHFDIIYLDLGLPDENSIELVKKIREDATNLNTKTTIIALTAFIDNDIKAECAKAGIQFLLTKPLDNEKIETAEVIMNNYINGRKLDLFLNNQSAVSQPIIDVQACLNNTNGNIGFVKEILAQFIQEMPSHLKAIQAAFQAKNWDELQNQIHKLNGAAAYCGASRLRAAVHAFEGALRKRTGEYTELYQQFNKEADLLMNEYKRKQNTLFDKIEKTLDTSIPEAIFSGNMLLVEDEAINQIIIKELLESLGFNVITADRGLTALEMLQAPDASYVIAVLDVGLPDISGIEVTRRLRASDAPLKNLPIIALTGHVSARYQGECLSSGMNGFIGKPATVEQLSALLKRILGYVPKG